MEFTAQEIAEIRKKLSFIVDHWAVNLVNHILKQARDAGVSSVYMNTMQSLQAGVQNEEKLDYFYDTLPRILGFRKEKVEPKDVGKNVSGGEMWVMHFSPLSANSDLNNIIKIAQKTLSLDQIPKRYQGAVLSIIGKKPLYTMDQLQSVLDILAKRKPKGAISKFYYDWSKS